MPESRDGTAAVAAERGATVLQEDELLSEHGPARGKGDAMWRGLSAASGDVVVYLDADTRDFNSDFVVGLLWPLLVQPEIRFVKGAFRRPLTLDDGRMLPGEGGRVTELVARPLLNLYAPHLAPSSINRWPARWPLAPTCCGACGFLPATGSRSPT